MIAGRLSGSVAPIAAGLWRWWSGELAETVRLLRPVAQKGDGEVRILIEQHRVCIERVIGGAGERFIEEQPFEALDADAFADIAGLVGNEVPSLILQPPDVLPLSLTFPKAAASRLSAAIAIQMIEIAPVQPELLTWSIAERRVEGGNLHVRLAMAKTTRIAALRARFEEHGLCAPPVYAADPSGDVRLAITDDDSRPVIDWRGKRLWLVAAALLATIPFTTLVGSAILIARVNAAAQALQPDVHERQAMRRAAQRMEEQRELLSPLYGQPGSAAVLNALAKRLPLSDWLRQIERRPDGSLHFTVTTLDEAALDAALRSEPLLPGIRVAMRSERQDGKVDVDYESDAP